MPLPLYGSGGRMARTSAAIWPTTWRSDALDHDLGLRRALDLDAGRHVLAPPDANSRPAGSASGPAPAARKPTPTRVRRLLEALADAVDHVGHQRAHRAAHRVGLGRLVGRRERQLAGLVLDADQRVQRARQRAERALDADAARPGSTRPRPAARRSAFFLRGTLLALLRVRPRSTALRRRCRWRAPCDRSSRPCGVVTIATPRPFITDGMSWRPL